MMIMIPDILKKRRDEWAFSEEEPWKPVAKENASAEVKEAIEEFLAEAES